MHDIRPDPDVIARTEARRKHCSLASLRPETIKERRSAFCALLRDPKRLEDATVHILEGHYGRGVQLLGVAALNSCPTNGRPRELTRLLCSVVAQCPADYEHRDWEALTNDERNAARQALRNAIEKTSH